MSFQVECPQGHLLEADAADAGQPCQCPHCGSVFLLPDPPPASPPLPATGTAPVAVPRFEEARPELLHIPCPNGHELETPREMLGHYAMCPYCQAKFRLREADSVEHRRRKELEERLRERRSSRMWMNYLIIAVVLVGLFFLLMLITQLVA